MNDLEKSVLLARSNSEWMVVGLENNQYEVFDRLKRPLFVLRNNFNFFTTTPIDTRIHGEPHLMYHAHDLIRSLLTYDSKIDMGRFLTWAKKPVTSEDGWYADLWLLYPAEVQHLCLNKIVEIMGLEN